MRHCIMTDPPDGTECGSTDVDDLFALAGDTNWARMTAGQGSDDASHTPFVFDCNLGDEGHAWQNGRIDRDLGTGGTRVTIGLPKRGDTFAAPSAEIGLIMSGDVDNDTELSTVDTSENTETELSSILFAGTGACGTELEDRYRAIITMGGDDPDDAAAQFTLIDFLSAVASNGARKGFLGEEKTHINEGNQLRELVAA